MSKAPQPEVSNPSPNTRPTIQPFIYDLLECYPRPHPASASSRFSFTFGVSSSDFKKYFSRTRGWRSAWTTARNTPTRCSQAPSWRRGNNSGQSIRARNFHIISVGSLPAEVTSPTLGQVFPPLLNQVLQSINPRIHLLTPHGSVTYTRPLVLFS